MSEEKWRSIHGFEDVYEVSIAGQIRRMPGISTRSDGKINFVAGKILKQQVNSRGYLRTQLCINGKPTWYLIHRLVAKAFIDNPLEKPAVNHIDGDKKNNHASNLEWVSYKENSTHALECGLLKPLFGHSKKSKEIIQSIFELKDLGYSQRKISEALGIDRATVKRYLLRRATASGESIRPKRGRKTSVKATVREAGSPHCTGTPVSVG